MRRARLRDVEIVEAIDVDRSRRVETCDIARVDSAVCAEPRDGSVGCVCDEEVSRRIKRKSGRSKQARALRNHDLRRSAASGKHQEIRGDRAYGALEDVGGGGGEIGR